jgi:DNA-binding transcriptional ArsR family regulator
MVYYPSTLDRTFGALADPTRRQIVRRLARRDETIIELAGHFDMTLPGISKHVRVLERAGLLRVRREGRSRRTSLVGRPMREAMAWIHQYRALWEHQFDRLAAYLDSTTTNTESAWPHPQPDSSSKSGAPSTQGANASSPRGRKRTSSGAGARRAT